MDEKKYSTAHASRADRASTSPQRAKGDGRAAPTGASATVASATVKRRLRSVLRGIAYGGIGFLLSGCRLFFGTYPLGLALLCAASRYTWYVLAGLVAGTLWGAFSGVRWVWISVYALAVILRLGVLFFVDPPNLAPDGEHPDGRGAADRRRLRGVARQWASLKALLTDGHPRCTGTGSSPRATQGEDSPDGIPPLAAARGASSPSHGAREAHGVSVTRRAVPNRWFNENPLLRIFTGAVCGFAAGLCGILLGGFAFYDLFAALFTLVAVPIATALFIPGFRREGQAWLFSPSAHKGAVGDGRVTLMPTVSVSLLLVAVLLAAREYDIYLGTPYISLRMAPLLAILLTLGLTARCGLTVGVVAGALAGLGADPLLSPGILLCAAVYALLRSVSVRIATSGGCVAVLLWCALLGGRAEALGHLCTCLLAIPLHLLIERLYGQLAEVVPPRPSAMADFSDAAVSAAREAEQTARLKALSSAFSSLSRLFYDMSDRLRRPRMTDMHRVCEAGVKAMCATCERREACRGEYRDLPDALAAHLAVCLRTHRTVSSDAIPPALRATCPHVEAMVVGVNARCGELTERCTKGEKTEVFAADYRAMADILAEAVSESQPDGASDGVGDGEGYPCDSEAAERIVALLTEQGLTVDGAVVCGRRERRVILRGKRLECLSEESMAAAKAAMEEACGVRLSEPTFDVQDGRTVMRMTAEPAWEVSFSGSTVPAGVGAEEILPSPLTDETAPGGYVPPYTCGDHIALFTTDRAYFYALISDGMGSGEEASLASDISTVFLERMLTGNFLRQKNSGTGEECSATVDLMELDLFCGDAVFFKNGAAPTYVIRGGTVYKLRSRTMPLGILRNTPPDALRFRTHPGDVVVMVSDGVTRGNDECPWLIDLLSSPLPPSMDALRLNILNHAIASGSEDDMTAIAVKVEPPAATAWRPPAVGL